MEIKEINISGVNIPDITVVDHSNYSSPPIPVAPPVTVNIGVPVVDIPGCVEAHETNNPKNNEIKSDDQRGLVRIVILASLVSILFVMNLNR